MKITISALLLLGVFSIFIPTSLKTSTRTKMQQPRHFAQKEDVTTIKARIRGAKASGKKNVVLSAPEIFYEEVGDVNDALSRYSLIIARPVQKSSLMLDQWNITTFYKFEIIEIISSAQTANCCVVESLPDQLQATKENEIYLRVGGGTINMDDVDVTIPEEFGELSLSQPYLLFISLDKDKAVGIIKAGAGGIFKIADKDKIETLSAHPHTLSLSVAKDFGSSIEQLRNKAKLNRKIK
jgi:hypothetical protein